MMVVVVLVVYIPCSEIDGRNKRRSDPQTHLPYYTGP